MRAPPRATYRVRCVFTCSTSCANARSVELEPFAAHECAEIGALRHRILPGLVLGPAVVGALAEAIGVALGLVGLHGVAPPVVRGDLGLQPAFVIAIAMQGD